MPKSKMLCAGIFRKPYGLKGCIEIQTLLMHPKDIALYNPLLNEEGEPFYTLTSIREKKGSILAFVKGIEDRTQAELLQGKKLFLLRKKLPTLEEEMYYCDDLKGLTIKTESGKIIGTIENIQNFGSCDILEGNGEKGVFSIPFTKEAVESINLDERFIIVEESMVLFNDSVEKEEKL